MQRLILMRHAKTEPWSEGIDDFARALTERGHLDARCIADTLASLGWSPDRILLSPARRTRETCTHIAEVVKGERIRARENLYLAGRSALNEALAEADPAHTLMLIGHNPGLHEFAMDLAAEGPAGDEVARMRLIEKFPTSCAALFEAEEDAPYAPHRFRLVEVLRASELRTHEA